MTELLAVRRKNLLFRGRCVQSSIKVWIPDRSRWIPIGRDKSVPIFELSTATLASNPMMNWILPLSIAVCSSPNFSLLLCDSEEQDLLQLLRRLIFWILRRFPLPDAHRGMRSARWCRCQSKRHGLFVWALKTWAWGCSIQGGDKQSHRGTQRCLADNYWYLKPSAWLTNEGLFFQSPIMPKSGR